MDPQPLLLSAAIASRAQRIKIRTSIHRPILKQPGDTASPRALLHERYTFDNLSLEDPLQVAEQVSIVDQLSQGRFI
jgi:alkanesulfonate monooxygenase SsuD/methylene tetrahydromethanopterin reductase-like flavin-dependent oxidoreductase (luciferase family)